MSNLHWWCYSDHLHIRTSINPIIWRSMSWKKLKDKFDEWMAIWIVFTFMASATIFQTFYILHLKSELKLFQKDEKISTNSVSDSVSIHTKRR
jgi:hypothetical protein